MGFLPTYAWKARARRDNWVNINENGTRDGKGILHETRVETAEFTRAWAAYRKQRSRYINGRLSAINSLVRMGLIKKVPVPYRPRRVRAVSYRYDTKFPPPYPKKLPGTRIVYDYLAHKRRLVPGYILTDAGKAMVAKLQAAGHVFVPHM